MNKIVIPEFKNTYKVANIKPLFQTLIGSHAHGLEHSSSDIDYRAVHVYNKDLYISINLDDIKTSIEVQEDKVDAVSYELGAFLNILNKGAHNAYEMVYSPYFEFYGSDELKKEFEDVCKACLNPYKLCISYIGAMASAISGLAKAFETMNAKKAIKCFFMHHRFLASYYYTLKHKDDNLFPPLLITELHKALSEDNPPPLPDINDLFEEASKEPEQVISLLCGNIDDLKDQIENIIKTQRPILINKIEETHKDNTELLNNFYRKAVYELSNNN